MGGLRRGRTIRRLLAAAGVTATALAVSAVLAGPASADPVDITLYRGDHARACTRAEKAAEGVRPGDTCRVEPAGNGEVSGPAWCWLSDDAPAWVRRARERMCS